MNEKEIMKDVELILYKELGEFNHQFDYLSEKERDKVSTVITKAFMAGLSFASDMIEKEGGKNMRFTDSELNNMAYALECRFGFGDDLAEKIYEYIEKKTGRDPRL